MSFTRNFVINFFIFFVIKVYSLKFEVYLHFYAFYNRFNCTTYSEKQKCLRSSCWWTDPHTAVTTAEAVLKVFVVLWLCGFSTSLYVFGKILIKNYIDAFCLVNKFWWNISFLKTLLIFQLNSQWGNKTNHLSHPATFFTKSSKPQKDKSYRFLTDTIKRTGKF